MTQNAIIATLRTLSMVFGGALLFVALVTLGEEGFVGGLTVFSMGILQFVVLQFMASVLETKKETLDKLTQIEGKLKE
ncbi:hypothetical protein LWL40_27680 (plasmid) [Bacillus thuringiensis]|uniref:hypothetical protein n=1 Tax=Bacillus thuringiensis TaxID=1428 RepID=UPI003D737B8A